MQLHNHTFLVTGGASGLGEATVRYLVAQGANAIIADLNSETGEKLTAELHENTVFSQCDITKEADVQTAIAQGVEKFGSLQGSINCAGIVVVQKVLDRAGNPADLVKFVQGVNVNLVGTFNVARLVAAQIVKQTTDNADNTGNEDTGIIINTASIAAFDGQVGQCSYASSKSGVVGLNLPMARELARYGIRVMTIAPGVFGTPMMASLPEAAKAQLESAVPCPKRLGKPGEFAGLVGHIISNAYLNGEVIRLDGAIRMS